MSLPERNARAGGRVLIGLAVALVGLSACTVRPLYSSAPIVSTGTPVTSELSAIAIKPVITRYAQEVRNRLIFLMTGGQGESTPSRYSLALSVTRRQESAAAIQIADKNEPSAATITLGTTYVLTEIGSGTVVAKGARQVSASYDVPRQEFANMRAEIDAENRAARELAELLHLSLAQALVSRPAPSAPEAAADLKE